MKQNNTKSLLSPTPAQARFRNRKWAEALLKNKRKARSIMYGCKGERCCLAVAQDVAHELGLEDYKGYSDGLPHPNVGRFFGWKNNQPELNILAGDEKWNRVSAVALNDGVEDFATKNKKFQKLGLSHSQIAECVLNTFVRPSRKKASFSL